MAQTEESHFTPYSRLGSTCVFPIGHVLSLGGVRRRDTCQVTQQQSRETSINSALTTPNTQVEGRAAADKFASKTEWSFTRCLSSRKALRGAHTLSSAEDPDSSPVTSPPRTWHEIRGSSRTLSGVRESQAEGVQLKSDLSRSESHTCTDKTAMKILNALI